MIIDAHTHIFSPETISRRDEICYSDACFRLLYSHPKAKMYSAEGLVENMDRCGISKSAVLNIGWESQAMCTSTNDYIIEAINRYPGRLIGFCAVQPAEPDAAMKEIERCGACGVKGVGELRPDVQGFDMSGEGPIEEVMKAIIARSMVLCVHASEPVGHDYAGKGDVVPALLYDFIRKYPGLKILLAHFGGGLPFYELMPEVKQALGNTFYDTAAAPFLYSPGIYPALSMITGDDKVLFGSDWPLIDPPRIIDQIEASGLQEKQINKILYGNAASLLGLGDIS